MTLRIWLAILLTPLTGAALWGTGPGLTTVVLAQTHGGIASAVIVGVGMLQVGLGMTAVFALLAGRAEGNLRRSVRDVVHWTNGPEER